MNKTDSDCTNCMMYVGHISRERLCGPHCFSGSTALYVTCSLCKATKSYYTANGAFFADDEGTYICDNCLF